MDKAKATEPRIQHNNITPIEGKETTPSLVVDLSSVERRQEANLKGNIIFDSSLVMSDPNFLDLGGEYLDWDLLDIDFADSVNQQTSDETVQSSIEPSSLIRHSDPLASQTVQLQQAMSSPKVSIPPIPSYAVRSLIQRPKVKTGAQRIASLILHTMKSYPLMMLRHNTLPPFIHPSFASSNVENKDMETLTNCISLVHMISSGVQGSRRLFWKNVRLECERLCAEVRCVQNA